MKISLLILENLIQETEKLRIAKAVDKAQELREKSWRLINERPAYQFSQLEAARLAVIYYKLEDFWAEIITEWNEKYWNDIQCWARELIKNEEKDND